MKIVPSNRLKSPKKDLKNQRYSPTSNQYIWVDRVKAELFLHKEYLRRYIIQNYSLGRVKQSERNSISNVKLYFDVNNKGFNLFANNFALPIKDYENITREDIEKALVDDVKKWHDGVDRFKSQKPDMDPKDFEDPDDMPPIDKGLDEIGITTEDFKL